jgi:acetate kinase
VTLGPILTVNGGSSSLHLAYVTEGKASEGGVGEGGVGESGVGESGVGEARVGDRLDLAEPPTSAQAMDAVAEFVRDREPPAAVAHRLVHGGERLRHPSLVDDTIRADLGTAADLAPLHVPPSLRLLDQLRTLMPNVPHVVCPDNAFHADLPELAATFPVPASWRSRWGLRRYGFHGLSYAWSTRRTAELLRRPIGELRLILAHLGGGASVCAVKEGRSVDTSMGFTPLDGVPMSTRSGAVDPGMLLWLLDGRLDVDQLSAGLHHESGLLGLSGGRSGDTRVLVAARRRATPRPSSRWTSTSTGYAENSPPPRRASTGWTRSCSPARSGGINPRYAMASVQASRCSGWTLQPYGNAQTTARSARPAQPCR